LGMVLTNPHCKIWPYFERVICASSLD